MIKIALNVYEIEHDGDLLNTQDDILRIAGVTSADIRGFDFDNECAVFVITADMDRNQLIAVLEVNGICL